MLHLAEALDQEDVDWRKTSAILLDNAPYHKSKDTKKVLESLNLPIMFSGPYSFDVSPVEMLFARTKAGLLNPNSLPLGKK